VVRIADQTGAGPDRIAAAFAAVRNSYDLIALNTEIEKLDNKIASEVQLGLFMQVQNLILDRIVWFLRNVDLTLGLALVVDHFRDGIAAVAASLDKVLSADAVAARGARVAELKTAGVPESVAKRMADLPALISAPDIVVVADRSGRPVGEV